MCEPWRLAQFWGATHTYDCARLLIENDHVRRIDIPYFTICFAISHTFKQLVIDTYCAWVDHNDSLPSFTIPLFSPATLRCPWSSGSHPRWWCKWYLGGPQPRAQPPAGWGCHPLPREVQVGYCYPRVIKNSMVEIRNPTYVNDSPVEHW